MKVLEDNAWILFTRAAEHPSFRGERVKHRRAEPLRPGGRCQLTLFEAGEDDQRAHPRLRITLPDAVDPAPLGPLSPPERPPANAEAALAWVHTQQAALRARLAVEDLDLTAAPPGSERWYPNSIRVQRTAAFFGRVRAQLDAWVAQGALPEAALPACRYAVRELEAAAYSGELHFDNADTGTYHAYEKDKPFVHYLEALLATLPEDGSAAQALLSAEQQHSVRRQRQQAQAHLDFLMRKKYAYSHIAEADIERGLGGLLIDRSTRRIVSETPESAQSLSPRFELLRVDPAAQHPHAGAWVYRDSGLVCTQDGEPIEVAPELLRRTPVPTEQLTFERAPNDRRLRSGVRFDWDGDGWVRRGRVEWVSWAGHCDIKAVLESVGATLTGAQPPSVHEYRSDTDAVTHWTRDLLLEMLASSLELGSRYSRLDGSGTFTLGQSAFGGARNDSRPDRVQFQGLNSGAGFRWPLGGRQDSLEITRIELDGQVLDLETAFFRHLPDAMAVDFRPNPRFLKTVEGDYNVIDVSGAKLTLRARLDTIDPDSGYPDHREDQVVLDLSEAGASEPVSLGTSLRDAGRRELWDITLDRPRGAVIARVLRYERDGSGRFVPRELPDQAVRIPLARPLRVTASREMKQDDPQLFEALIHLAIRRAQNICADTDAQAEVWNGVVHQIKSERVSVNAERRIERWRVLFVARFGRASLEYLVQLDESGRSVTWCPLPSQRSVDFLWQDLPDVGSKARIGADWAANQAMLQRNIVEIQHNRALSGGVYVADDHIKQVYELLWTALSGHRWAIVHDNKRYAFSDEASWQAAVEHLRALRSRLRFVD